MWWNKDSSLHHLRGILSVAFSSFSAVYCENNITPQPTFLGTLQVVLMLSELLPKDAQREVHETVFEYQEWHLVGDWRALADPGRSCTLCALI